MLLGTSFSKTKDSADDSVSRYMEVSYEYWDKIVQLIQPGLYAPAEKSFSGDFYAVFAHPTNANELWLLVVQFKSGDKIYSKEMVCEEVYKSFNLDLLCSNPHEKQKKYVAGVVLVLVGGLYSNITFKELNSHASQIDKTKLTEPEADSKAESKKTKSTKKKQKITESEEPKQKKKYPIPEAANLQVLLLNDLGKKHLLSAFNLVTTKI